MRGMEIDLVGAFLALGVPLPEVIRESTTNPATNPATDSDAWT